VFIISPKFHLKAPSGLGVLDSCLEVLTRGCARVRALENKRLVFPSLTDGL
jgi:hypothetical protein